MPAAVAVAARFLPAGSHTDEPSAQPTLRRNRSAAARQRQPRRHQSLPGARLEVRDPCRAVRHRQGRHSRPRVRAAGVRLPAVRARLRRRGHPRACVLGVCRVQGREGGGHRRGRHARPRSARAGRVGRGLGACWSGSPGTSRWQHRRRRGTPAGGLSAGGLELTGAPLDRRRPSRRASSFSTGETFSACSRERRTASAAGRRARRSHDLHRGAWRRQLGHDAGQSAGASRERRCGSGPTSPRWWRRSIERTRIRCSCPACPWRRGCAHSPTRERR